jgi:hypothetical protein
MNEQQAIKEFNLNITHQSKSKGMGQIFMLLDYWNNIDEIIEECVLSENQDTEENENE